MSEPTPADREKPTDSDREKARKLNCMACHEQGDSECDPVLPACQLAEDAIAQALADERAASKADGWSRCRQYVGDDTCIVIPETAEEAEQVERHRLVGGVGRYGIPRTEREEPPDG